MPREHPPSPRGALVHAWAEFLSRWEWEWFGTFTVDPSRALNELSLHRTWNFFINRMNRTLYGPRYPKKIGHGVNWVRATEYTKKGVPHYHALIGYVGKTDRQEVQERWWKVAGFAKIGRIRDAPSAYTYCAKYVLKGGGLDIGGPMKPRGVEDDNEPALPFPGRAQ